MNICDIIWFYPLIWIYNMLFNKPTTLALTIGYFFKLLWLFFVISVIPPTTNSDMGNYDPECFLFFVKMCSNPCQPNSPCGLHSILVACTLTSQQDGPGPLLLVPPRSARVSSGCFSPLPVRSFWIVPPPCRKGKDMEGGLDNGFILQCCIYRTNNYQSKPVCHEQNWVGFLKIFSLHFICPVCCQSAASFCVYFTLLLLFSGPF